MNLLYLDVEIFFRETLDYSCLNYLSIWYLDAEVTMDGRRVVRRLYDSFAAWDMEAFAGLLSDDVVFHVPGTGANASDHRGREWVFAFLEQAAPDGRHAAHPVARRAGRRRARRRGSRWDLPTPIAQARE